MFICSRRCFPEGQLPSLSRTIFTQSTGTFASSFVHQKQKQQKWWVADGPIQYLIYIHCIYDKCVTTSGTEEQKFNLNARRDLCWDSLHMYDSCLPHRLNGNTMMPLSCYKLFGNKAIRSYYDTYCNSFDHLIQELYISYFI